MSLGIQSRGSLKRREYGVKSKFISNDIIIGALGAVASIVFGLQALQFPGASKYFPSFCLFALMVFSFFLVIEGITRTVRVREGKADYTASEAKRKPYILMACVALYVVCVERIGYFVSSLVFMPCCMYFFGQRKFKLMVAVTVGILAFLYWLFVYQLNLNLPSGILF